MIADTERLIDGFRGVPAGMDGSKDPPGVPDDAVYYATNVTFRGGNGPRTRPGFREIPPTYWRNPQPRRTVTVTITSGVATATTTSGNHGYEDKDKVTISGATPAGVNGIHVITVTGTTTFTFKTSATGTVTGTIRATRDVDATYGEDLVDGKTSRERVAEIIGATLIQGVIVYQDPREGNPSQMVVVADGLVYTLNFDDLSCFVLNPTDAVSDDVPVYMTQAEKFLIIQTGQDEPRVYDGYVLRRSSYYGEGIPIGKQMGYGQGRLFVAVNEGSEIIAGDLVFGGSTTNVGITVSSAANPTLIATATNHGFVAGDQITISGHSSTPPINSTYTILTATNNTFTIPVEVTSAGSGGFVARFNAGQDSDLLRFTENTFLNEGGSFSPSGKIGRVTGLVFLPVQDTTTGQGDLIAFCERGAATFQVSAPRDQWKNTQGFQRVLYDNIGSTSESIIPVNGDLFFRSREGNGIRTYRNARAEADGYGQTPISAEIDPVLRQDTQWMLDQVSMVNFDNRLLMTCLPKRYPRRADNEAQAEEFAAEPIPTLYDGIAVLDFNSVSVGRGKAAAVFDGVWTGLRIHKLVQGTFDSEPRCFALCLHEDDTGRRNEIWEVTKNDEYDTPVEGPRLVNASIVSRAYDFKDNMSLKKLLRCDLWFDDIGGGPEDSFTCNLAYRPDDYPNFTAWQSFQRNFVTKFLLEDKNLLFHTEAIDDAVWSKFGVTVVKNAITNPFGQLIDAEQLVEIDQGPFDNVVEHYVKTTSPVLVSGASYTFSIYVKPQAPRDFIYLSMETTGSAFSARKRSWFHLTGFTGATRDPSSGTTASIQALDNGWYRCSITADTDSAGTTECIVGMAVRSGGLGPTFLSGSTAYRGIFPFGMFFWGAQLERANVVTSYDPDPPQLLNYERGYAPQVKFPTPPRTANLATDVPAYLGHDFTLRVEWSGHARLGRLMLHGSRITEAVNGGSL